jgi:hypothetical protein
MRVQGLRDARAACAWFEMFWMRNINWRKYVYNQMLTCCVPDLAAVSVVVKEAAMRIEMPGMTNVVRFPLERRVAPPLDLLASIAPDSREVDLVAEAFDLGHRLADTRHEADRAMAEHILNNVAPEPGVRRRAELDGLLRPLIARAVEACRQAHRAAEKARAANERLVRAQAEGGDWIDSLEERAAAAASEAARLLIVAHLASEEAQGAARAVSLARSGEPWEPFDIKKEEQLLFFGEDRRQEPA